MGSNKVRIGWGAVSGGVFANIDGTAVGTLVRNVSAFAGQNDVLYASGSAPLFACRAWVSFLGTSGAMYGAGNVSSVTRTGTGSYVVNFTTAMPSSGYAAVVGGNNSETNNGYIVVQYQATTQVGVNSRNSGGFSDGSIINVAIFHH